MPRKKKTAHDERVFMPLFCRDFLMSTIGWSATERGHYLVLLMVQWDAGSLPSEMEQLERISGGISEHWGNIKNRFQVHEDGRLRNARLEMHRARAIEICEKRRENGRKGGKPNGVPNGVPDGVPDGVPLGVASKSISISTTLPLRGKSSAGAADPPPPAGKTADRTPGYALPVWESVLASWNDAATRCRHIARFDSLHPPRAFHDRMDELGWADDWQRGIERLERCRWFTTPVSLTFFLKADTLSAILGGTYDGRKPTRPGEPANTGPVVSSRMWRDDACANLTDEQYAAWRKKQAAAAAGGAR